VITSAGLVLAGTFAALGTLPLVFITEIGFAVAFGVLLDTFGCAACSAFRSVVSVLVRFVSSRVIL
jgi:MMPL family